MLLHVTLSPPPPASLAAATERQQLAAFEAALAAALREEGLQGEGVQLALLPLDTLPAAEESQQAAGAAGLGWERLPCGALANPVCIASSGDGLAPQQVRLGLLGQAALQLPGQPRVAVMRQGTAAAAGGDGSWRCQLLDGPQQVWAPAAAQGRRAISLGLPQCSGPALLTLHLLPPAGGGGRSSSPAAAHPLASLPLLCLPEAAAEEALQLFGSMVAEVAAAGGTPAEDESQAARQAFWQHFAPFAYSWGSLMLEAESGGGSSTGTAAGPVPAAAAHLEEQQEQEQEQEQEQQGAAALQAADLLWFLLGRRMPACLEVALELVGQLEARWPGIGDQVAAVLQQRLLGGGGDGSRVEAASEPAAVAEEAAAASSGSRAAAAAPKPEEPPEPAAQEAEVAAYGMLLRSSLERRSAAASASSKASTLSGGGGGSGGLSSCSSAADLLPSDSAASSAPSSSSWGEPLLPWRAVLHGFSDPSTEAAYLHYMSLCKLSQWDVLGALLNTGMAASACRHLPLLVLGGPSAGSPSVEELTILAAVLLFELPWLAMLANRRWFLRHRESLMVWLGGAGRLMVALGHGVLSLLTGRDHCAMLQSCAWVLLACAVNQPLIQQVRFRSAAPLIAIDAINVACYWVFKSRSAAVGAAGGLAAGVGALAVAAAVDGRCRAGFVRSLSRRQ